MVRRLFAQLARPRTWIRSLYADLDTPARVLLLAVAVVHALGIGWGLPASDGWDVDGVAPRDFLPGVIESFTPGHYFTYPPLHLLLLTVLTLPVTLVALARAPSLAQHDVVQAFTAVPVMTTFAYVARVVSLLMSLGIVLVVGNLARAIFGPRARNWAMAIAGVEVAGTYYAHTTNLDVPALFWASLALLQLVHALKNDEPRRLRRVAVLAACAIASKDQAYAVFLFSMPCVLGAWMWSARRAGSDKTGELLRETVRLAVVGLVLVLLFDGAIFNPTGFAARVRFLTGPASQDFAQYSHDWTGRFAAFADAATFLPKHYPTLFAPVFALGVAFAVRRTAGRERIAAVVPLLAILSFTLAFNCVARRVEERFMLPQMQLLAVYGGGAVAGLLEAPSIAKRAASVWMIRIGGAACILAGLRLSAVVIANMLGDPRYDAESYLREHVRPGEVIEVYGSNVYLPRFPADFTVQRIGPTPPDKRNPMPGIVEKEDRLGAVAERAPKWIVVSKGYAWRFIRLPYDREKGAGKMLPESQREALSDEDATTYMLSLFGETAGYRAAHIAHYEGSSLLPPHPLHASLACDVWIFERR